MLDVKMTDTRGRPRNFNEKEAVEAMVLVFWQHGYDGTTMRMLEEATGIGVRGIANVFGDKDAIFLRVLEAYAEQVKLLVGPLFEPPSVSSIEVFFGNLAQKRDDKDPANHGCLMVNTVFGLARLDGDAKRSVEAYRKYWLTLFRSALQADGLIETDGRAEFLVNLLWGALAQIRLAGSTTAAEPMAKVAVETIKGWRGAR